MKLGFIGTGNIGLPICTHLAGKGHEVHAFDLDAQALARAVSAGAHAADSPVAVARQADVVFTCLPGPAEVEEVVLGADGIARAARDGLVLVDLTTNFPEHAQRIAAALAERGVGMLEAPVGNGVVGARAGRSSVICFCTFFHSTPNGGLLSMKSKRLSASWSSDRVLPSLMLVTSWPLISMSALQMA